LVTCGVGIILHLKIQRVKDTMKTKQLDDFLEQQKVVHCNQWEGEKNPMVRLMYGLVQ
jgi:hypothetical protein